MGGEKKGYSLAMIVRNCAEDLDRCLASYAKYPDEIVVVNTGIDESEAGFKETNESAKKHGAKVFHFPWTENFSEARQFSFDQCTQPFILWLDSDDTVEKPGNLDHNIRLAIGNEIDCIFVEYVYEHGVSGEATMLQKRERVVRKDGFRWAENAPIHEVLISTGSYNHAEIPGEGGRVSHNRVVTEHKRARQTLLRNKRILEKHFGPGGKPPQIRMTYYWGNTLLGLGDFQGALEKFLEYTKRSTEEGNGNKQELVQGWLGLSKCYAALEQPEKAQKAAKAAAEVMPITPTPYSELANLALRERDFEAAAMYAKMCLMLKENMSFELCSSPRDVVGRPHLILAHAACYAGAYKDAKREVDLALPYFRSDPQALQLKHDVEAVIARKESVSEYVRLRSKLMADGREDEARELFRFAPAEIADTQEVACISKKTRPQDKRSIAIVCPSPEGHVPWGPWSIERGIGGSEEAVINMTRELSVLGWHVEVYGHTGRPCQEGPIIDEKTGAHWYRYEAWSGAKDAGIDVAISWRSPALFTMTGAKAKLKFCWLHDIFNPQGWRAGCERTYDGFFFLTQYHRSLFGKIVPDDKVILTSNGIDPSLCVPLEDLSNEPHRMVWGSDPIRGLQFLLPWWKQIREAIPDASLRIFYGWSEHFFAHMRQSAELREAYEQIESLKNQPGIEWKGKVGQKVLAEEFSKAAIVPYMSNFPEISCITAMKAMAHGCTFMGPDDFALPETCGSYGKLVKGPLDHPERQKEFVDRLIEELRSPTSSERRMEVARWARSKTWASIAQQWHELFLTRLQSSTPTPMETAAQR